jgi:hypothetical protein
MGPRSLQCGQALCGNAESLPATPRCGNTGRALSPVVTMSGLENTSNFASSRRDRPAGIGMLLGLPADIPGSHQPNDLGGARVIISKRLRIAAIAAAASAVLISIAGTPSSATPAGDRSDRTLSRSAEQQTGSRAADVTVGWYRIRSVTRTVQCLQADVNTRIYVVPCSDNGRQHWLFGSTDPTYPAQYREVRNEAGGCLDADNRGGRLTGIIHLYTCNKSKNQAWSFSQPPSYGVACVYVANLCDWRPTEPVTGTQSDPGLQIFLQKTTEGGIYREWLLEPLG